MLVREARNEDLDDLVRLGRLMREESKTWFPEVDPDKCAAALDAFIRAPEGCIFVAEDDRPIGFISGALSTTVYSNVIHASVDLVFVEPSRRGFSAFRQMMKRFEDWARENEANHIGFGSSTGMKMDKIMNYLGYVETGILYRKVL